jgi:hypothetical protein
MEFNLEELQDIYDMAVELRYFSIIEKIKTEYTKCGLCEHLVLNSEFDEHYCNSHNY